MMVFGLIFMFGSAGAGCYLAWSTRDVLVQLHFGAVTWTGHLYAVLVVGALLACWFMLGAAFVQCRLAERGRIGTERAGTETPVGETAAARPARRAQPVRL